MRSGTPPIYPFVSPSRTPTPLHQPWDGAEAIEGLKGLLIGVARKLNAAESPLKLAGNFGTTGGFGGRHTWGIATGSRGVP